MSFLPALREHVLLKAEDRPGVYRMLDGDGEVLYVGKSVRVRTRLLSYFTAEEGKKAELLMREAHGVEWEYVPNEFEALLKEMRLIQRHRPRYNVQHKRRPSYCFVKITREPAPRLAAVTRVAADDAIYFGPFPSARHVADTVTELCRALGIRDCPSSTPVVFADQLEIFMGGRSPRCLRGDLGTCLAPCAGLPDAATYRGRVREAHRFLEGRGEAPIERLRGRMAEAAERRDFEYAALLRDRITRLSDFRERLGAWRGEMDALTFLYRVPGFRGEDRLYLLRRGRVKEEVAYPKSAAARAQVAELVEDVYRRREPSPRSLEREEAAEILFVAAWFKGRPKEMRRTKTPKQWLEERRAAAGGTAGRPVSSPRGS